MTWSPDPDAFVRDLEAKPGALRSIADMLASDPWGSLAEHARVVITGMGSSRFAAMPVAARLRARGIDAVAEYASTTVARPGGSGMLAIGVSASGSTPETVEALARHREAGSSTVAVTNADAGPLAETAAHRLPLGAGVEAGGVACRTFQHTLALLLAIGDARAASDATRRAADATEDLLARRDAWLPAAVELLEGTGRQFLLAPDARSSSAAQGALMFREGPRSQADACETGDWLHVDVYLTKPLDYRALLFAGSRFDAEVLRWLEERDGRALVVGGEVAGAARTLRYPGDDDETVALLTETLVAELVAAELWRRARGRG